MRTDTHNNPTALTTDLARQAGLALNKDYEIGEAFPGDTTFHTARLLGDPIALTIRVIDEVGFYTSSGKKRWIHTAIPDFVWHSLSYELKKKVIGWMYKQEGGVKLRDLFLSTAGG